MNLANIELTAKNFEEYLPLAIEAHANSKKRLTSMLGEVERKEAEEREKEEAERKAEAER